MASLTTEEGMYLFDLTVVETQPVGISEFITSNLKPRTPVTTPSLYVLLYLSYQSVLCMGDQGGVYAAYVPISRFEIPHAPADSSCLCRQALSALEMHLRSQTDRLG